MHPDTSSALLKSYTNTLSTDLDIYKKARTKTKIIPKSNTAGLLFLLLGSRNSRPRSPFEKISVIHNHLDYPTNEVRPMSLQCPRCHSPKFDSFHHAMKIGAIIGTVGGATRGVSAALAGSQAGAIIGAIAGPLGITLGSISGAILGGLAGGIGGCALGAQLGESLDRHVLAHNLCLLCGHRFNLPT